MATRTRTVLLLLLCGTPDQQVARAQVIIGNLPPTGRCDLATLSTRVTTLNARCCTSAAGGGSCSCTIPCSSELLPLLDECRPTLDIMLDMEDGTRDGVARQLDTLHDQCLAIPPGDVLAELKTMNDGGTCSDEELDGVALTDVVAAPCADTNKHCDLLLAGGLACDGPEMSTDCKATCQTCDDGGGKRRAQITSSCPLQDFEREAAEVNDACCDAGTSCTGVPTACDAKCAIVFDDFFARCSNILGIQAADQLTGFTDLYTTCSQHLPVESLLRAVAACNGDEEYNNRGSGICTNRYPPDDGHGPCDPVCPSAIAAQPAFARDVQDDGEGEYYYTEAGKSLSECIELCTGTFGSDWGCEFVSHDTEVGYCYLHRSCDQIENQQSLAAGRSYTVYGRTTCIRITTGEQRSTDDAGYLTVFVDAGAGYQRVPGTGGDHYYQYGSTVMQYCYDSFKFVGLRVGDGTTDGWSGTIEQSFDLGTTWTPMTCVDCTCNVPDGQSLPTTHFMVDGDNSCSNGEHAGCMNTLVDGSLVLANMCTIV